MRGDHGARNVAVGAFFLAVFFCFMVLGGGGDVGAAEFRITLSADYETTPTLGQDSTGALIVYTTRAATPSGYGPGSIYYRRLSSEGAPVGDPVLVSAGGTDDQLNDVGGSRIVFTAFNSTTTSAGTIYLYDIPTVSRTALASATSIREARVHGDRIAWIQGAAGATQLMFLDLIQGTAASPIVIAGPTPPATNVEVGDRFVVWDGAVSGQRDVCAYDAATGQTRAVATDPAIDERFPATSGPWVVFESRPVGGNIIDVEAVNLDTGERRTIVANGSQNLSPTIDGDFIAYESRVRGNYDIYVHSLSTGRTYQVTDDPADQRLNNVFGDMVSYVDARSGDLDVYVSSPLFPPEADAACQTVPGGLVGCYTFRGNAADGSGNGHHGALLGSPAFGPDRAGNAGGALILDGTDDYVRLPHEYAFDLPDALTIAAIIQVPDYQRDHWILSKGTLFGNYTLRVLDDVESWPGYLEYVHNTAGGNWSYLSSSSPVPRNAYFHLAITLDAMEARAYLNGNPAQTAANPALPTLNNDPATIGAGGSNGVTDFFKGAIDDLRIYNRALTDAEVCTLFNGTFNTAPTADAGADQGVHAGGSVTLSGSASTDPEGNTLSYAWRILSVPAGSAATLDDPASVNSSFVADSVGTYTLALVVTDRCGLSSTADTVAISTSNTTPVADAGDDKAVVAPGTVVTLDGKGSYDLDGDPLAYAWTLVSKPDGSGAALSDPASDTPNFAADVHGQYVVSLVVSDPWASSDPDEIVVSSENVRPVANAGGNQAVLVGETAVLDGTGSFDANSDPLTYRWSLIARPAVSQASLGSPAEAVATLVPDAAGIYVASLTVNDGLVDSAPSTVTVTATRGQDAVIGALKEAIFAVNQLLAPAGFRNRKLANPLTNKINAAIEAIDQGLFAEALSKLQDDVLAKTDGCATGGHPDPNDWITNCGDQGQVYPLIVKAIALLRPMVQP